MTINRRQQLVRSNLGLARRIWSHRLFRRMLHRQGIDPRKSAWRETEALLCRGLHRCARCAEHEACHAWLAGAEADAGYVRFCPNSETIEVLRIAQS